VPLPDRGPSGHLLEAGGERVLFDAGSGTLGRLARVGVTPDRIDRVFITHFHLDHLMDLPTLLFALKNPALDRDRVLPVAGPPGLERIVAGFEDLFGDWLRPALTRVAWEEIEPGRAAALPCGEVTAGAMRHTSGSLGFRVRMPGGGDVVYTGDTGYDDGVIAFARDTDVLVCECALPEAEVGDAHLSPELAGRLAAETAPRKLVLTHFYPEVLATDIVAGVRRWWDGPLELANDLHAVEVEDA
jgi:ribonuclease BN (tRNA processing enzyme)